MAENNPSIEGDAGEIRAGARDKKPTENGLAYQIERSETAFKRALSSWRRQACLVESVSDEVANIRKERDRLGRSFNAAASALDAYSDLVPSDVSKPFLEKLGVIAIDNQRIVTSITNRLREIQLETKSNVSVFSKASRASRSLCKSDARGIRTSSKGD